MNKEEWIVELKEEAVKQGFPKVSNQWSVFSLNCFALESYRLGKTPEQTVREVMETWKVKDKS